MGVIKSLQPEGQALRLLLLFTAGSELRPLLMSGMSC